MTDVTNTTNYITVLRTNGEYDCLAKQFDITENGEIGVVPYDNAALFTWRQVPVGSIQDLLALLTELNGQRREAIIRGVPANELPQVVRRSASNFPEHPEGSHFVMLDIDGIPTPDEVHPCSVDAVRYVISLLPAEFKNASCVYQFSNSAGICKPGGGLLKEGIRVHLFFYLGRRIPGPLLAAYLEQFCHETGFYTVGLDNGGTPMVRFDIDMAPVKSSVQLHYTASPSIGPGVTVDIPDGQRIGMVTGSLNDVVLPEIDPDLPRMMAERRRELREEWALANGFSKKSMGVQMERQSRVVEYLEAPSTVRIGRSVAHTELTANDHVLRLYFTEENSPGSWYVKKSCPWMATRYGDEAEVPLRELCPEALEKVRELGWAEEVPADEVSTIPTINFNGYALSENGVKKSIATQKGSRDVLLCSPITVQGLIRDIYSKQWSYMVKLWDRDGKTHEIQIPAAELLSERFRISLMENGATCSTALKERAYLAEYIQNFPVEYRYIHIESTGWIEDTEWDFALPDDIFGQISSEDDDFYWDKKIQQNIRAYRSEGSLEDWRNGVANYCEGNYLPVISLCSAFLPPLLKPMSLENFGVHIRGSSSTGKTKALMVAASVWGNPAEFLVSWRTTDNALEGLARSRNDSLLTLDELALMDPNATAQSVYMLGNGQGKSRMVSDTSLRDTTKFRLVFLSTGEISLREHLANANGRIMGGHEVRFIDLRADAGAGMGVFQHIHGFASPGEFAQYLDQVTTRFYGTPIREFLHILTTSPETMGEVIVTFRALVARLQGEWQVPSSDPQVQRVCHHFACLAAAGELAIDCEILPFTQGHAIEACHWGFQRWLEDRGGLESADLLRAYDEMEHKLLTYGFTRFDQDPVVCASLNIPIPRANPCWGFLHWIKPYSDDPMLEFWIPVPTFDHEFAAGVNKKAFAEMLVSRGVMDEAKSVKRTVPGIGQRGVYVIKGAILQGQLPEVPEPESPSPAEELMEPVS